MTYAIRIQALSTRTAILRSLGIAIFCLLSLPATAATRCGLPADLMRLVGDLYAFSSQGEARGSRVSNRIRQDIREIDMRDVNSKLFAVGLAQTRSRIESLLAQAQNLGSQGEITSPSLLRERLNGVARLDSAVCKLEEIQADQAPTPETKKNTPSFAQMLGRLGTTARIALLLAVTGTVIWLVLLIRLLYDKIHARVINRRACRIPCAIEQGLDVIDGTVTILGARGCRFQPANKGAYARAEQMVEKDGIFVVLGGARYPISTSVAQEYFLMFLFQQPLTRAAQMELLELSSITPKFVSKSSTRKRQTQKRAAPNQAGRA